MKSSLLLSQPYASGLQGKDGGEETNSSARPLGTAPDGALPNEYFSTSIVDAARGPKPQLRPPASLMLPPFTVADGSMCLYCRR
jgi:hypothetical protein